MEPKYVAYSVARRYRPFCIEPTKGLYVVVDTQQGTKTMPHPKLEYWEHPWRGRLLAKALSRQEADSFANELNGIKPKGGGSSEIYRGKVKPRAKNPCKALKPKRRTA